MVVAIINVGSPSAPTFTNVTAAATSASSEANGIRMSSSSASTFSNVVATASGAVTTLGMYFIFGGTALIRDSFISGAGNSVRTNGPGTVHIADTILNGPTVGVGAGNCVDVLNTSLTAFTCA